MTIFRRKADFRRLTDADLAAWRGIPTTVASDVMNRGQAMSAAIRPLQTGMRLAGQARTVTAMVADSSIVHAATAIAEAGDVLVMNVGAYLDRACWGEVATRAALERGVQGVVMDGSCRDSEAIRALGFPVFCAGIVAAGPHKGHGGRIDGVAAVGGVTVAPGDVVIGDDDGVVVVPLGDVPRVLQMARQQLEREQEWLDMIASGGTMSELLGLQILDED